MLSDLLHEAWERRPDATSGEIAAEVMGTARTRQDLFELVLPAVIAQATVVQRRQVRQVEDVAFGHSCVGNHERSADVTPSTDDYHDPLAARKAVLRHTVYVNHETGYVPWGEMTAEMHMARAEYLERKAHGHLVTADRHRTAAKFIDEAGVSCINDLPSIPDELFEEVMA